MHFAAKGRVSLFAGVIELEAEVVFTKGTMKVCTGCGFQTQTDKEYKAHWADKHQLECSNTTMEKNHGSDKAPLANKSKPKNPRLKIRVVFKLGKMRFVGYLRITFQALNVPPGLLKRAEGMPGSSVLKMIDAAAMLPKAVKLCARHAVRFVKRSLCAA